MNLKAIVSSASRLDAKAWLPPPRRPQGLEGGSPRSNNSLLEPLAGKD